MIEMSVVLLACGILLAVAYEFAWMLRREWGENQKSFF